MQTTKLEPDAPTEELWAEIFRLRAEVEGPTGYASWKDAAVAERVRRVKSEKNALRYAAIRLSPIARSNKFGSHCDEAADAFLKQLAKEDPTGYELLKKFIVE